MPLTAKMRRVRPGAHPLSRTGAQVFRTGAHVSRTGRTPPAGRRMMVSRRGPEPRSPELWKS